MDQALVLLVLWHLVGSMPSPIGDNCYHFIFCSSWWGSFCSRGLKKWANMPKFSGGALKILKPWGSGPSCVFLLSKTPFCHRDRASMSLSPDPELGSRILGVLFCFPPQIFPSKLRSSLFETESRPLATSFDFFLVSKFLRGFTQLMQSRFKRKFLHRPTSPIVCHVPSLIAVVSKVGR